MVELSKKTLINVSFDRYLFQKELRKALKWIKDSDELQSFKDWCLTEFGHLYPSILRNVFKSI